MTRFKLTLSAWAVTILAMLALVGHAAQTITNVNTATPNSGTGDPLFTAFNKINTNFNFLQATTITNNQGIGTNTMFYDYRTAASFLSISNDPRSAGNGALQLFVNPDLNAICNDYGPPRNDGRFILTFGDAQAGYSRGVNMGLNFNPHHSANANDQSELNLFSEGSFSVAINISGNPWNTERRWHWGTAVSYGAFMEYFGISLSSLYQSDVYGNTNGDPSMPELYRSGFYSNNAVVVVGNGKSTLDSALDTEPASMVVPIGTSGQAEWTLFRYFDPGVDHSATPWKWGPNSQALKVGVGGASTLCYMELEGPFTNSGNIQTTGTVVFASGGAVDGSITHSGGSINVHATGGAATTVTLYDGFQVANANNVGSGYRAVKVGGASNPSALCEYDSANNTLFCAEGGAPGSTIEMNYVGTGLGPKTSVGRTTYRNANGPLSSQVMEVIGKAGFSDTAAFTNGWSISSNSFPIAAWSSISSNGCGCITWMSNATLYLICTNALNTTGYTNKLGGL